MNQHCQYMSLQIYERDLNRTIDRMFLWKINREYCYVYYNDYILTWMAWMASKYKIQIEISFRNQRQAK